MLAWLFSVEIINSGLEIFTKPKNADIFSSSLPSQGELITTPLFDGTESYIAYPPLTNIHDDLRVELEFKPVDRDGLVFFCGGKKMKVEDFVAISMVDGHVEFRYELGTGKVNCSCAKLNLNSSWETLSIHAVRCGDKQILVEIYDTFFERWYILLLYLL